MKNMLKLFPITVIGIFIFGWMLAHAQEDATSEVNIENVTVSVLVEGLRNPLGLAVAQDGTVFIAEEGTGNDDTSAGVSILLPDGSIGRLISGIRSGRDSGDLSGVALVGVSPDGRTLYAGNFAEGHLWTLPIPEDGFASVPETPFMPDDLGITMEAFNRVTLTNPFDITFDDNDMPIVADASQDGVARQLEDGRVQFFHRFDFLTNPIDEELVISPVPTGIDRIGDEYYVTLTGGCPYPTQSGELVAIDEERNQRTVVDNLNMPIDVQQDDNGTIWVLEFARFAEDGSCFSGMGYLPDTGRLSRLLPDSTLQTVVDNLNFPGAVQPMPDGTLVVSEIFDGELLQITFGVTADEDASSYTLPDIALGEPTYLSITDTNDALQTVIEENNLQPNPGIEFIEGDTELAELGRDLFFDPILSGDMNISCASCHHPALAMADARVLPIGSGGEGLGSERTWRTHIRLSEEYIGDEAGQVVPNPAHGQFVPRNSPTIINAALLTTQFWDGRVQNYQLGQAVTTLEANVTNFGITDSLVAQALFPTISRAEMGGATFGNAEPPIIRNLIVDRLQNNPIYAQRFSNVFGADTITPVQMAEALAAFERQLIFTNAPWDAYLAGDETALTEQQQRGALLFFGALNEDVNCAVCHSGDLFTDQQFHNILSPQLGPGKGNGISGREDWGRANVTFDWQDRFMFRTPSLRNVTLTAPYFHTGAYPTLESAIVHHTNIWANAAYYDPSANLPQSFYSSVRPFNLASQQTTVSPLLADGMPLSDQDVADLVAFLESLTDPAATDLMYITPESVPSGLALDPLPDTVGATIAPQANPSDTVITADTSADIENTLGWQFVDVTDDVGLDFEHQAFELGIYDDPIAMMGGGLCWIDYDNDNRLDLYLVNSHAEEEADYWNANGGSPTNALYRNTADGFVQMQNTGTDLALRGNGCVAGDFNLDGWYDLYITADGDDVLLLNNTDGTFRDITPTSGIVALEWNSAAAVADVNGDGLPDLFVGGYIDLENKIPNPFGAFPQDYYGIPDRLYIHQGIDENGNISFVEATLDVGIVREERTLGAIFTDVDRDGDLDLYVANDGQPNRLYENVPDTDSPHGVRFLDLTDSAQVGDAGSGMGVTSADYDGDGFFDLFVTNWEAELNALYRNETEEIGDIQFRYSTYRIGMMGLGNDMTGWGTTWADFDHDTDIDLVTVNGRVPISNFTTDPELVRYYNNRLVQSGRPHYFEFTEQVGLEAVGTLLARGSAVADYDNDGDLDIAINVIGGRAVLLENTNPAGNWLQIQLEDFAPGTVAIVTLPDGTELVREWHTGSSYLASEDPRLHFGLGDIQTSVDLQIVYRGERQIELNGITPNQQLVLTVIRQE